MSWPDCLGGEVLLALWIWVERRASPLHCHVDFLCHSIISVEERLGRETDRIPLEVGLLVHTVMVSLMRTFGAFQNVHTTGRQQRIA